MSSSGAQYCASKLLAGNHNAVPVLFGRRAVGQPLHAYWDTTVVKHLGKKPA